MIAKQATRHQSWKLFGPKLCKTDRKRKIMGKLLERVQNSLPWNYLYQVQKNWREVNTEYVHITINNKCMSVVCMYRPIWGFRARQHLRYLAAVMKEYWWLWWPNDIRGPLGPKVPWHLCYRRGKTRKNLAQETCPDRGSNPHPLRDKRTCYHLLHSGGQYLL